MSRMEISENKPNVIVSLLEKILDANEKQLDRYHSSRKSPIVEDFGPECLVMKNRIHTSLESQGKNGNLGLSQRKSRKVRELFSESRKIRFCWKSQGKIVIIYFQKKALCPCILIIFMVILLCSLFHFSK